MLFPDHFPSSLPTSSFTHPTPISQSFISVCILQTLHPLVSKEKAMFSHLSVFAHTILLAQNPLLIILSSTSPPSKINSRMSFYSFLKPSLRYPTKLQSVLSFELRVSLVVIIIFSLRLQLFVYLVLFPLLSYNFLQVNYSIGIVPDTA